MRRKGQDRGTDQEQATRKGPWLLILGVFGVADLVALLSWGAVKLTDPHRWSIREIRIEGEFHQLKPDRLKVLVANEVKGGFFTVQIETIRHALLREPWVRHVSVRRIWPDRVQVTVEEHRAVARWGNKGLLSPEGVVFSPPKETYPQGLAVLEGPDGTEAQVHARFQELQQMLANIGWSVARLTLSSRRAWSFEVVNGPKVMIGRIDFNRRVQRLVANYHRVLGNKLRKPLRVDLRYPNGFAVSWGDRASQLPARGLKESEKA